MAERRHDDACNKPLMLKDAQMLKGRDRASATLGVSYLAGIILPICEK